MPVHFNPADVQAVGIGLAAFLATLLATFVFISSRHERLGRAMWICLASGMVWAWFGFLYHIVPGLDLAREMRVISVMGIVWLCMSEMYFAVVYLSERVKRGRISNAVSVFVYAGGAALSSLLLADFFGAQFIVGDLLYLPATVLAPHAGPLMSVLIAYYIVSTGLSGVLLAWRARAGTGEADRRQALILFVSMTVGLALGGTRFTPWYGFDFYPLVGSIGFPLFVLASFYSIRQYYLLNLQVAAAQLLVFALWSFTFFRVLLNPSLSAAIPDIGLFVAVLILGVFLLRSIIVEGKAQRELAMLTIDRVKSEFVTIAAHQLRTPLSAVRWSLDLLLTDSTPLTQEQRSIAEKGSRAAANMIRLVNDLLNVSRIHDGKFGYNIEPGDVRDAVRVAVAALEDLARSRNVEIVLGMPTTAVAADFDRGKLAIGLENLVDNAIKYTHEGGSVKVSITPQRGAVSVSVSDTGIGISPDDRSRLFEKFFRGKDAVRMFADGSGLGLFITKTIIEGHGGQLAVVSEQGKGTIVTFSLPVRHS